MPQRTITKEIYSVEQILPLIDPDKGRVMLDGDWVRVGSMRLQTFKIKGTNCAHCGIEGSFFRKEYNVQSSHGPARAYHLNLYAINERGEFILMIKDHIIPRCKGGHATLRNLQPMCELCNGIVKKDKPMERLLFLKSFMKFSLEK